MDMGRAAQLPPRAVSGVSGYRSSGRDESGWTSYAGGNGHNSQYQNDHAPVATADAAARSFWETDSSSWSIFNSRETTTSAAIAAQGQCVLRARRHGALNCVP